MGYRSSGVEGRVAWLFWGKTNHPLLDPGRVAVESAPRPELRVLIYSYRVWIDGRNSGGVCYAWRLSYPSPDPRQASSAFRRIILYFGSQFYRTSVFYFIHFLFRKLAKISLSFAVLQIDVDGVATTSSHHSLALNKHIFLRSKSMLLNIVRSRRSKHVIGFGFLAFLILLLVFGRGNYVSTSLFTCSQNRFTHIYV